MKTLLRFLPLFVLLCVTHVFAQQSEIDQKKFRAQQKMMPAMLKMFITMQAKGQHAGVMLFEDGDDPEFRALTKSKYIFLKNPENLTDKQAVELEELMNCNLRVIRAYLMKEDFERFWSYKSSYWAGRFLDEWCVRAMRSKIEPMKKFIFVLISSYGSAKHTQYTALCQ